MSKTQYTFKTSPANLSFYQIENDNYDKLFYVIENEVYGKLLVVDKLFGIYVAKRFREMGYKDNAEFKIGESYFQCSQKHIFFLVTEKEKTKKTKKKKNSMKFITYINKLRMFAKEYESLKNEDMKVKVRF